MKPRAELAVWARQYRIGLSNYIKPGSTKKLKPALALGFQAVTHHLEILDVANIHERAVLCLSKQDGPLDVGRVKRANRFFVETLIPIEQTHHAARSRNRQITSMSRRLCLRKAESSTAAKRLQRGITQRKLAEEMLKKSSSNLAALLRKSYRLQAQRKKLVSEKLSKLETNRFSTSSKLHTNIAQALLAINFRLLTLKMSSTSSSASIKKEIAQTQKLVEQTVQKIQRLTNERDQGV